ncbi:MAG: MFS transporter [Micrococcales bacterium]|nr:MFS transporter [Micrococcales bacterium]
MFARIRDTFADPVLRSLTVATLISTVGRGVSLTLVVLYLSLVAGLPAEQVALVYAIGSGIGIAASYLGGHLADSVSARWMLVGGVVAAGLALASVALVTELWQAVVAESVVSVALGTNGSVRSAIIARAFSPETRVTSRAVLRTVTNIGITIGTGVGAIALALGTAEAYRAILVVGGIAYAASALLLVRLPARVDAPSRAEREADADAVPAAGRSPWRDPRYLLFSGLAAVFAIQFVVLNVGIPLWVAHDTVAPEYLVSIMFIVNTVLVIALQVPLSRGTHDLRRAGNVTAVAGVLMALGCVLYGAAAGTPLVATVVLLVAASVLHALSEVLSQGGAWGLSFELADPRRPGAYQGMFSMTFAIASMVGPLLITWTAISMGFAGWLILAAMFLLAALGVAVIAHRAARSGSAPQEFSARP